MGSPTGFLGAVWRRIAPAAGGAPAHEHPAESDDSISPQANAALAEAEFNAGVTTVRSTPPIITLETTSRCNLRCVMCPHALGDVRRPKHLSDSLVGRIQRFVKRATDIQLHGIGEPTLSPAFWGLLPALPPPQACRSSINTNLTRLDDERLDRLLNSNLKVVNVSLDAASEATYRKIRGFSFGHVLGNIERLLAGRNERGQAYPLVHLNMTLMRSNIEELADFIRLAARLGVDQAELWHLNRAAASEMARYVIEKEGWTFDYAREGLWNHPALSNRCIREAVALATEVGMPLYLDHNKPVYFDDGEAGD